MYYNNMRNFITRYTCSEKQIPEIITRLYNKNMTPILYCVNENKNNHYNNFNISKNIIEKYPNNTFAIKLSSLNIENNYNLSQIYMGELCNIAINNNSVLLIDAENYSIQDKINEVSDYIMQLYNKDKVNIYKTYQTYRTDSFDTLIKDIKIRNETKTYLLGIKLVRGAYYNQDSCYNILYKTKKETDLNFDKSSLYVMMNCLDKDKLLIASHNKESINKCDSIKNKLVLNNVEYAQLMGMSDDISFSLANSNNKVYKYVPFGNLYDSMPYLLRRLYENKSMFMHL